MLAQQETARANEKRPRIARWITIAVLVLLVAASIDLIVVLHNWPFTQKAITEALQNSSSSPVQIGKFRKTYFPPGCVAEDVHFVRGRGSDQRSLILIQKLAIRGNYGDLLTFHRHVDEVHVMGMHVMIPPRNPDGKPGQAMPPTERKSSSLLIGKVVADGAVLEFLPRQEGKEPYKIAVQQLSLSGFGSGAAMRYSARLMISKPPGEIRSAGKFGPWNPDDPGRTQVSGSFTYEHANLGVSHNVAGILDGKGTFDGALDQINVTGSTDVPDFEVSSGRHKLRLTTKFQAVVNGTDGDTFLKRVEAHMGRTTGIFEGSVAGEPGRKGKFISLDMSVRDGRIEDLLRLFSKANEPAMAGVISLRGKARVPPGPREFIQKLLLTGDFGIDRSHFTKPSTQDPINRLSESAAGEKKDQIEQDPRIVLSNLKGHVSVANGIATLTRISFSVPGALARMQGTFNLKSKMVELHGVLETDGKLSDTTSGFKALVLKAITPFYKKKKSLRMIPFHITGLYGHTTVGLDIGK